MAQPNAGGRLAEVLSRAGSMLALGITQQAGRGLVARQPIPQGTVVLQECPLICAPAPQHRGKVCYDCLRVFQQAQQPLQMAGQAYCGRQCADRASGAYAAVEGPGGSNFAALSEHCVQYRERFPLLAARLACSIVQNGHSPAVQDMQALSFANMAGPPPQPWVEVHGLIQQGLRAHCDSLPPGSQERSSARAHSDAITLDWLVSVMARLHVNAFRVDAVLPLEGRSLAEVAAALVGGSSDGHSGSALYLLSSLFNHSCMPSVDVQYTNNSSRVTMRAARDIDRGEEVFISYIDANMPLEQRQQRLQFAYGFVCRCAMCTAQSEDATLDR